MYTTSSPEKGILSQKKNGSPYPIIHGSQQRLDVDQETVRHQYKRQTPCSPDGFWLADSS